MSIYLVKLNKMFKPSDRSADNVMYRIILIDMLKYLRCLSCGKKVKMRNAIGHHSLPWGRGEVFCNRYCLKKES